MAKRSTPSAAASSSDRNSAAQAILDDLADVLREAGARGVDLAACFQHFDRRSEGLVDVDSFMTAVAELRIGGGRVWDEADAESCVERVSGGRSRAYFSRADFLRFFTPQTRPPSASTTSRVASASATRDKKTATKVATGSAPPAAEDYVDAFRRAQHQQHQHASLRAGVAVRSKKHKTSKPHLLPPWARDRNKRALQELENLQRHARRLPPSVSSRLFCHDESQQDGDTAAEQPQDQQLQLSALQLPEPAALNQGDVLEFPPTDSRWRSFELDNTTSLAYALLSHDSVADAVSEPEPASRSSSKPLHSAKCASVEEEAADASQPNLTAFRFTVVLDALQQLETLAAFFRPLLLRFPRGKVLVCGFPTRSPRQTVWNNDAFARAYAALLVHVMRTTREWLVQPKVGVGAVPQFVVAFGSGASTALRLLGVEIPRRMQRQPALELFLRGQRGLVLVNGLAHTTESARQSLQTLRRALASAENRVESHEALAQSVFSAFYLTQVATSRRAAMESFFRTRTRFLEGANLALLRVLLHGGVKHQDVRAALSNLRAAESPFALVLVHGTLDALFGADQAELVAAAFPPECVAPSLAACLATDAPAPQVHVSWLKSGHEVLQERASFMHELFRQVALVDGDGVASATAVASAVASAVEAPEAPQPAADTRRRQSAGGASPTHAPALRPLETPTASSTEEAADPQPPGAGDFAHRVAELLARHGIKWVQQELFDRGLEGSGASAAILARFQRALECEHQQERDKAAQEAAQRARLDAREAQARERQREELERQVREQEAQQRIRQRERGAQKAFFAQMEAQKLATTRAALERELMALEDVHSQRQEALAAQESERELRNAEVTLQIEEIEAERLEREREQHQVALQQERLAAQLEKRERLKRFQLEFEQRELAASPVAAYALDLAPTLTNFGALAAGARALAADLVHFYELKAAQKDEAAARRAELHELRATAAAEELAVRNLERVVRKAKATGMVARAGLGTVRVVPITALEFQALARDLDEHQDALARLQHDLALRAQELAWKDTLLQRLRALVQRNEGFRGESLRRLQRCAETGSELVLCAREDGEQLFEQRERSATLETRCAARLLAVRDERARAAGAATAFFDSRLRVEGAVQRVHRVVLLREHDAEIAALETKVAALRAGDEDAEAKLRANKRSLAALGAATLDVKQSLRALELATGARARGADDADSPAGSALGDASEFADAARRQPSDLAELVRRKPHASRSGDEKRWVALDFRVNEALYYKRVAPEEVEIVARHAEYQQPPLSKAEIERVLALPARNCLALAFVRSPEELEAHRLLRKFTCGDGEDHFARLDAAFALASQAAAPAVVTAKLEELPGAVDAASSRAKAAGVSLDRGRGALLDERAPPVTLLSASQCELEPHASATHSFSLPAAAVGVLALTVSVVFQGRFRSTGYQNGRLAAQLYVLPPAPPDGSAQAAAARMPVPVGKCFSQHDIALCTPQSLGKLVLRHEPTAKPLCAAATYQVVLGAPVFAAYSLEVTATTALAASEVLRAKRVDALKKQELLPRARDEVQNVFVTLQLSERKKRLARAMAADARDAARAAELEMLRTTRQLEADDAAPALGPDARAALHAASRAAEAAFTRQCFLFAAREDEARDVDAGLQELARVHADLLQQCDAMERDLLAYRAHLPPLAAALVDSRDPRDRDAAGARVARELHAEYASAASGKVRWAELSAMKAALPSMLTPAERLRRKYKKGRDALEKKEREWVLLDRLLHPRLYDWEAQLATPGDHRLRLHGAFPALSKDEEQLAVLSSAELERILQAPWNLLARREIGIRKIVARFRDDAGATAAGQPPQPPTTVVALLRSQKPAELTAEEREWRAYDQVLHPSYYPRDLRSLAAELTQRDAARLSPSVTREDVVAALNTPEDELVQLPSDLLRARSLLLKFDPQLRANVVEAAHVAPVAQAVETDVDARCRLVYQELQRAIANTRNETMDSSVLHATLQRFPTKVLRLELEKELDRLLVAQVAEKEAFELRTFLAAKQPPPPRAAAALVRDDDSDPVSDSDSDEEAQLAREAKARRRAKAEAAAGKNAKVRGKALKLQSVQRQRREIRDALRGRSLEERRRLLQEQELGAGGCMACLANPCAWLPYLQASHAAVERRIEVLQEELERVKRCAAPTLASAVCLAAVKSGGGAVTLRKTDLFDEVTRELKRWDRHLRLRAVDAEFHATFRSAAPFFETRALHGFAQTQLRDKVQSALAREHDALVSGLAAAEVVDDVLESMLEGWVFGERESEREALGFVPSLKRDGPLTLHDLRVFEQQQQQRVAAADVEKPEAESVQGVPLAKWQPIAARAFAVDARRKAVQKGSAADQALSETENALKFGLFCMTLMYFRGLAMLKTQRRVWAAPSAHPPAPRESPERRRMLLEARNVARRQQAAAAVDSTAQAAQARKRQFLAHKTAAYRQRLVREHQQAKREVRAAQEIQRVYRGHLGKRAGAKWMLRRREIDAQRALAGAAATTLQRAYRGRLGRLAAEAKRVELAEFIAQVRAEEAIEEEEEYWRRHRLERAGRQVAAFVRREA